MKFGYTVLFVASVADTIAFYEHAFGLTRGMVNAAQTYGELQTGDTKLAFAQKAFAQELTGVDVAPQLPQPAPMEIGLIAQDVEAAFETAVQAGAVMVRRPSVKPWGQIVGYLRDNNGFLVEICSAG